MKTGLVLFLLPTLASSFAVKSQSTVPPMTALYSSVDDQVYQDYADKWLNLQDQIREQQDQQVQPDHHHQKDEPPKVPTFETDYLAAAKMRAAQRPESNNAQSKLEDWQSISEQQRKQYGIENDDWDEAIRKDEEKWGDEDI